MKFFSELEKGKNYKTEKQWRRIGYVPVDDKAGVMLWTNRFCQKRCRYLSEDEVMYDSEVHNRVRNEIKKKRRDYRNKRKAEWQKRVDDLEREVAMLGDAIRNYTAPTEVKTAKTIVLDTKTTGLHEDDEILQLSIIDDAGNVLFNEFFKPIRHTSWESAERIHHISPAMVADEKTIYDYFWMIFHILRSAETIVGYNVGFDLQFLSTFCRADEHQIVDVMDIFAEIYGVWDERHGSFKYQKLAKCAEYYGYDWKGEAHDSLADARATLFCWKKMMEKEIK